MVHFEWGGGGGGKEEKKLKCYLVIYSAHQKKVIHIQRSKSSKFN